MSLKEYDVGGQPVRVDTNLSQREFLHRVASECPQALAPTRPTEKRNGFQGHLICWWRTRENYQHIYRVEVYAYDLITRQAVKIPQSQDCRDYSAGCKLVRDLLARSRTVTPAKT
jgi:hypothetical protein